MELEFAGLVGTDGGDSHLELGSKYELGEARADVPRGAVEISLCLQDVGCTSEAFPVVLKPGRREKRGFVVREGSQRSGTGGDGFATAFLGLSYRLRLGESSSWVIPLLSMSRYVPATRERKRAGQLSNSSIAAHTDSISHAATMPALYSSNPLDRSPSLSSNSSGASSLGPITPALPGSSTFPSPAMGSEYDSHSPNPSILRSSRGSIANLAAYSRGGKEAPSRSTPTWTAGHRAGSASVDSPRTFGGLGKSPSLRTGLLPIDEPKEDKVAAWRSGSPRTRTLSQVSQYENRAASPTLRSASPTPSSPSHHSYVPSPSSYSPHPSPTAYSPHPSSPTTSARALSSSIFSSRSPALPPPHSPLPTDLAGSVVGSVRSLQGSDGLARTGSFARGHRRAMTLPHLGEGGLPVPPGEAEVVGAFFFRLVWDRKTDGDSAQVSLVERGSPVLQSLPRRSLLQPFSPLRMAVSTNWLGRVSGLEEDCCQVRRCERWIANGRISSRTSTSATSPSTSFSRSRLRGGS